MDLELLLVSLYVAIDDWWAAERPSALAGQGTLCSFPRAGS